MPNSRLQLIYLDDSEVEQAQLSKAMGKYLRNPLVPVYSPAALFAHLDNLKDPVRAVILVDLELPGVTGYDVVRQLRSQGQRFSSVPAIIVTGADDPDCVRDAAAAGANAYIVKPIGLEALMRVLRKLGDYEVEIVEPTMRAAHA